MQENDTDRHSRLKFFTFLWVLGTFCNDIQEVFCQHKRDPLPIDAKLLLEVSQEMAEVDVEYLPLLIHHYVVRIPIADPENESCHAVPGTRLGECVDCLIIPKRT